VSTHGSEKGAALAQHNPFLSPSFSTGSAGRSANGSKTKGKKKKKGEQGCSASEWVVGRASDANAASGPMEGRRFDFHSFSFVVCNHYDTPVQCLYHFLVLSASFCKTVYYNRVMLHPHAQLVSHTTVI